MQRCRIAGAILVACITCGMLWGQDAEKSTSKAKTSKESAAEKVTGRLPNNYGKIGLSDAQKQKIYATQAKYAEQIEALVRQVEELRAKRDAEVEGVLTAEQKEKLKALLKESSDKKSAGKSEKPDGSQ